MKEKWRGHSPGIAPFGAICFANTRLPPLRGHPATPRDFSSCYPFLLHYNDTDAGDGGMWYPCYSVEKAVVTKKNAFFENKI